MIIYPPLATAAGLSETGAGIFLGASIHDVAQVVGAGYSLSPEAAKTAVLVKLFRVACLAPVVLITAVLYRQNRDRNDLIQAPPLPAFLIAFIALMCASSFGLIKPEQALFLGDVSQWLLLAAVVAIGAKTPFSSLRSMGLRAFSVMLMQTLLLAAFTFGFLYFSHIGWR